MFRHLWLLFCMPWVSIPLLCTGPVCFGFLIKSRQCEHKFSAR